MKMGPRSWRAALALLAIATVAASAADQCTVNDLAIGVPDGRAKYLGFGPMALTPPQVKVTTIIRSVGPLAAGSAASPEVSTATVGSASMPGLKPAPRPARPVPKNDQERLFAAVFDGDLAAVERLLRSSAVDVNAPARSDLRRSLIDVAAMTAQPQIARALIEHGARVRGPVDAVDVRPIGVAIFNLKTTIQMHGNPAAFAWVPERSPQDFEATIRVLLDAGADADGVLDPTHPESALGVLLSTPRFDGDMRIARLLLDHGAQLGASTPGGSPLAAAVANGRDELLDLALEARHVDPSALDVVLAPAVARRDAGMVSKLLAAGASPDARDQYGRPLLCDTLMGGEQSRSLAILFLQHGARPAMDCVGGPPLNLAMKDRELALLLLDRHADPSRIDHNGATALNLAADTDHELIDALLAHGARLGLPISEQRFDGMENGMGTPAGATVRAILHRQDYLATGLLRRDGLQGDTACAAMLYAATVGAHGTLAELLHRGADPNSMTQRGVTALMTAAYHSDVETVRMLLAQPAIRVDRTTPSVFNPGAFTLYSEDAPPLRTGHRTALMYAAAAGNPDSCKLLIQHGASPRETDAEGWTALDYARSPEVHSLLQTARGTRN
jgi:ankyrin repeat protein